MKYAILSVSILLLVCSVLTLYRVYKPIIVYKNSVSYLPALVPTPYEVLYHKVFVVLGQDGEDIPAYLPEVVSNIVEYSLAEDIDPDLVASLIYVESTYNKYEHNWYGATGLTQIVPRKLKDLMKKCKITSEECYRIDYNIMLGTTQLRWFIDDASGNIGLALYRYSGSVIRKLPKKRISLPEEGFQYLPKMFKIYYRLKNVPM